MYSFFESVYQVIAQIPYAKVASYGQIACLLGNPQQARTVGWALKRCPDGLPWHRVVKADGSLAAGEYVELQQAILSSEGVSLLPDGKVDMTVFQWDSTSFSVPMND